MNIFGYYFNANEINCVTPFKMTGKNFNNLTANFKVFLKSGQIVEVSNHVEAKDYFKQGDDSAQYLSVTGEWVTINNDETVPYEQLMAFSELYEQYIVFKNRIQL